MRPDAMSLARVQAWMQDVVTHPGDVDEALASPSAAAVVSPDRLDELVRPSARLTSAERVGVYHDMYLLRMSEALTTDYPALRHHLGEERFDELVRDYVQVHPSSSYTLNRLGDRLPEFVETWGGRFLADLARLELAITEVFDAPETPALTAEALAAVPAESWNGARLVPVAAFRLCRFGHAVLPHLDAYKQDRPSPRPRRRASFIAVYRRDYTVYRDELDRAQFEVLEALASGMPLGEALETVLRRVPAADREQRLFRWFRQWMAAGMFQAIEA